MRDLAGDTTLGTYTPVQLYAGEAPIVTFNYKTAAGVTLAKYEVFAVNSSGDAIKFDPAGSAPANKAVSIAMQPAAAASSFPNIQAGAINHEALVWPASGIATYALRRAAFQGTPIHIMRLL
jgi:hypothetical protein